jgi:sulfite exporter TauE/SafE
MSLVPGISNSYLGAFVSGLFYGLAFCTSACLPYLASYIAGIGAGFRRGITITLAYNSGRIIAYAMIGGAIGVLSGTFRFLFSEASLLPFQQYSSLAFGIVTIIIGAIILLHSRKLACNHSTQADVGQGLGKLSRRFDFGAFSLGLSRGLVICPALLALLVYSLPFATPLDSFAFAVLFGLGTALSPLLILGGATGWLLNKAPLFRKWISRFGGLILIVLGAGSVWIALTVSST